MNKRRKILTALSLCSLSIPFGLYSPTIPQNKEVYEQRNTAKIEVILPTVQPSPTIRPTEVRTVAPIKEKKPEARSERVKQIQPRTDLERIVFEAADRNNIPRDVAWAQTKQESNFNPNAGSSAGALGLLQIIPSTGEGLYGKGFTVDKLYDPEISADLGFRYLRSLWTRFGSLELGLAAYNAGEGIVGNCGCIPNYAETLDYIAKINGYKDQIYDERINIPSLEVFESGFTISQNIDEGNHQGEGFDNGIDLVPNNTSDDVLAGLEGQVIEIVDQPALCGNGVVILSPSGLWKVLYCHLEKVYVKANDEVQLFTPLGRVGQSGEASGIHTHSSILKRAESGEYKLER